MDLKIESRRSCSRKRAGMENDETVPNQSYALNPPTFPLLRPHTHCYHFSGGNEIVSKGIRDGLKEFQFGTQVSSLILKDFQLGGIGGVNSFQNTLKERAEVAEGAEGAEYPPESPYYPFYKRVFGRNKTFDIEERKTFISSGCNHLWLEKLYGITRVAVYGVDSICVVTWNEDLVRLEEDLAQLRDSEYAMDETLPYALILEVEDLACPPDGSRIINCKRSQKPFGVVSVIPGTNEVQKVNCDKTSGDKFDELKAIEFLQKKLNNTSHFTFHKTVQNAIRAFHRLWNKKFKPNNIRVFVWKSEWENEDYDCDYDETVQELKGNDLLAVYYNDKQYIADTGSEASLP